MFSYNTKLVKWAADYLISKWGTVPYSVPEDLRAPYFTVVQLPPLADYQPASEKKADELMAFLWHQHKVVAKVQFADDKLWIRLNGQIVIDREDFFRLAEAVLSLQSGQ